MSNVTALKNPISGNASPNQLVITDDYKRAFKSYDSIIAMKTHDGKLTVLDEKYWNYSKTTTKWLCFFLGDALPVVKERIENGDYQLRDLNDGCYE